MLKVIDNSEYVLLAFTSAFTRALRFHETHSTICPIDRVRWYCLASKTEAMYSAGSCHHAVCFPVFIHHMNSLAWNYLFTGWQLSFPINSMYKSWFSPKEMTNKYMSKKWNEKPRSKIFHGISKNWQPSSHSPSKSSTMETNFRNCLRREQCITIRKVDGCNPVLAPHITHGKSMLTALCRLQRTGCQRKVFFSSPQLCISQ